MSIERWPPAETKFTELEQLFPHPRDIGSVRFERLTESDGDRVWDSLRQFPEKFLPLMLANALNDEPIPVYGDGLNVRDWIYVDDHCRAILLLLQNGRSGGTYNIGARNQRRNIDVAHSVLDALGKPRSLIQFVKDRPGHDRRYAIDPTLIEKELDWHPRETWESGLRKTIDWYRDNAAWIDRVCSGAYREYYARQYGMEAGAR